MPFGLWLRPARLFVVWPSSSRRVRGGSSPGRRLAWVESPAVAAVGPRPLTAARLPLVPAAALLPGCCASAWAGPGRPRRASGTSLLGGLAPASVTVTGPSAKTRVRARTGGTRVVAAREVTWRGGASTLARGDLDRRRGTAGRTRAGRPRPGRRASSRCPRSRGSATRSPAKEAPPSCGSTAIERLGASPNAFVRATQWTRGVVGGAIERVLPPREAGLLLGLALGDDSQLDPATERDFQATGLTHLLVVSGGNVAMLIIPVLLLAKVLRLARVGTAVLGIVGVAFIVILTGAEPSVPSRRRDGDRRLRRCDARAAACDGGRARRRRPRPARVRPGPGHLGAGSSFRRPPPQGWSPSRRRSANGWRAGSRDRSRSRSGPRSPPSWG